MTGPVHNAETQISETQIAAANSLLGRRAMFQQTGIGLGGIALGNLLGQSSLAQASPRGVAGEKPRAKSVIFMHMVGAPSHLDLFEYKPLLQKYDGQKMPDELWDGLRLAFVREQPNLLGTRFRFGKHGECGMELSENLPFLAQIVDDITLIKSLHSTQFNHAPAQLFYQTGFERFGRPSLGSWASYGLGTENSDLPAFVVMNTGQIAGAGNSLWGSGFLPTRHQGVEFRRQGDPVLFLSNPRGVRKRNRKRIVDAVNKLNAVQLADVGDPEIATRISQYELAFRMQSSVPELVDLSSETDETLALYGIERGESGFASNCLLARRLVERGVRFVQLYDQGWDHHSGVANNLPRKCRQVDRPAAALVLDLKRRGLLDDTLVIFGAEFGRTPMLQGKAGKNAGRDHHKDAFCAWMAGGGVKGGLTYGQTDDLGFHVVENKMHINDLHATILHLLGIDHTQLTFAHQGRQFRLTDVGGVVHHQIVG